jgi:pyruvate dehydrogenase E1 component alpha subunit
VTFRWYGHVDWREDLDVGVSRSTDDLANWRARDPISRLAVAMEAAKCWSAADHAAAVSELESDIASAWDRAMNDPWPADSALLDRVYAS